jgi:hypothetical protein
MNCINKAFFFGIFLFFGSYSFLLAQSEKDSTYFLSKGRLFISPTFSVSNKTAVNEDQLLRFVEDQNRLEWDIDINVGYFIKDNFSVGAQLSYQFSKEDITYVADSKEITERSNGQSITFSPNIRNYFGLGKLKIFNQTNINYSYGEELKRVYREDDEDKIRTKELNFGIGIQPGLAFFVSDIVAVEASLKLLGWESSIIESTINDNEDEKSKVTKNDVSFSVDILTLHIGIGIYLDQINKKK